MKILIINSWCHPKNKNGFENILKYLKVEYKYGNINDIKNYDIIYSPSNPIDTSIYPNKKFIFGPHFSVSPDYKLKQINNIHKNSVYVQPSIYPINLWVKEIKEKKIFNTFENSDHILPLRPFPFPVETDKFKPLKNIERNEVFVYYKDRSAIELKYIIEFLNSKNIKYKVFNYLKKYKEDDYLNILQKSKYGIVLDRHESQGFAIEEALSCNVPLLVWNIKSRNQQITTDYYDFPATSIPYWDKRCGEFFYNKEDLEKTFDLFIKNIDNYNPREFIIENISTKKCSENLINLINGIKV